MNAAHTTAGTTLPYGTLNMMQVFDAEAGEALVTKKCTANISFTGLTPAGSHIMKCAVKNFTPHTAGLDGK